MHDEQTPCGDKRSSGGPGQKWALLGNYERGPDLIVPETAMYQDILFLCKNKSGVLLKVVNFPVCPTCPRVEDQVD